MNKGEARSDLPTPVI